MKVEKVKIVIVDDEQDLCFLLSNMLASQGFDVSSFYTLATGLEAIMTINPQWIIMDNDLPDGRGWEKATSILQSVPGTNIIMISANPDSRRDFQNKSVYYLIKPINVNSILELINNSRTSSGVTL